MLNHQKKITYFRAIYIHCERVMRAEANIHGSTSEFQSVSRGVFLNLALNTSSQETRGCTQSISQM